MKIFVLGRSGAGKTPMAAQLAAALGVPHVRASAWARASFPHLAGLDRQDFVEQITRFSTVELARDPWRSFDHLRRNHDLSAPCVIEGVRNPLDFVHLYDPRRDATVWIEYTATTLTPTVFERGLEVIDAYLRWLDDAGLSGATRLDFRYPRFRRTDPGDGLTLDDAIEAAIAALPRPAPPPEPAPKPSRVHADIPPLRRLVREEYLYGMDPAKVGGLVPCTAIVVSSYPGEAPTFQILLGDGAVFSYVPPSALIDPEAPRPIAPELALAELIYFDCPDEQICVHRFAALDGAVLAYFKQRDLWLEGTYLFTIDWWTGNHLAHAVALFNGQLAILPHHKLKFGSAHAVGFAPYKKMRKQWKVGVGDDAG